MDAIILAAGRGTRMWPLCSSTPKPCLPVAGRSLLHRVLDSLAAAGVVRAVIVTAPDTAKAIRKEAKAWGGKTALSFVDQKEAKGTGHAIAAAARRVKGDALVVVADALVDPATVTALRRGAGFLVAAAKVTNGSRFGVLTTRGTNVVSVREKPAKAGLALVNAGAYRVPAEALAQCASLKPSRRGELEFTDILHAWAKRGEVRWVKATGWVDVGRPWDLLEAQASTMASTLDLLLGKKAVGGPGLIEPGVHVAGHGRLYVEAGAVVRSGVYVDGDVHVAAGAKVGPNAYLRGPVSIGPGCHVGAGCEIKASVLLAGAKVPHLSYVGDSVLGEDCNLGAGTQVANLRHDGAPIRVHHRGTVVETGRHKLGVIVGDHAKTGINSSLLPGTILGVGAWTASGSVTKGTLADGARP